MFQGIIEQKARVITLLDCVLTLAPQKPWKFKNGESVSVNGVCLTVTKASKGRCWFDMGKETQKITTLGSLAPATWVNIERPLRFGEPISGHIVLGHVDTTGRIENFRKQGNSLLLEVAIAQGNHDAITPKGCLAVEGVSLTVNDVKRTGGTLAVSFCLIPETLKHTNFAQKKRGDLVNIETDYLARLFLKRPGGAALSAAKNHAQREGAQMKYN